MADRARRVGLALGAVLLLLSATGCAGEGANRGDAPAQQAAATTDPLVDPEVDPLVETPEAPTPDIVAEGLGASPRPSRTPTRAPSSAPRPRKSPRPPTETLLPPPPNKPAPNCTKPRYVGTQATREQAKAALTEAAGRVYWPTSAPSIRVPVNLVKATAWQESGWQSNIISCDEGIGLMQVMRGTEKMMNDRFGQTYDVDDYRDNATLGANYLAWLIKYIGDAYFEQDYRVDASLCGTQLTSCLLNGVISAYNNGHGNVVTSAGMQITNESYVRNVRALMTECECLDF